MHLRESSHDKDQRLVFAYRYLNSIVFEKNLKIRTLFIKSPWQKWNNAMGKYYRRFKQNTWNGHIDIFVEMWDVGSMDVLFLTDYVLWRQLPYFRILGSQECMCVRLLVGSFYFHVCHRSLEIFGILDASVHNAVLRWTAFLMPELL